jgi:hypothetical protein
MSRALPGFDHNNEMGSPFRDTEFRAGSMSQSTGRGRSSSWRGKVTMEHHHTDLNAQFPKLEHADLDRRLSRLEWPAPSPEVRERGLAEIRRAMDGQRRDERPHAPVERTPVERTLRFELTRWRPAGRTTTWSAPRRQPRLAISL